MTNVIDFPRRHYVRFFQHPVTCDACYSETPGYVYEGTGMIVCHVCHDIMLELKTEERVVFVFEGEDGEIE